MINRDELQGPQRQERNRINKRQRREQQQKNKQLKEGG